MLLLVPHCLPSVRDSGLAVCLAQTNLLLGLATHHIMIMWHDASRWQYTSSHLDNVHVVLC